MVHEKHSRYEENMMITKRILIGFFLSSLGFTHIQIDEYSLRLPLMGSITRSSYWQETPTSPIHVFLPDYRFYVIG